MKRRQFLKTASLAGTALSIGPLAGRAVFAASPKSKVVIAKDPLCFVNNKPVAARIQDMVDHVVMELTGVRDKPAAYEALFPKPVTASTIICLKYNGSSSTGCPSYLTVEQAVKNGLTSMLGGKFPAANITRHHNDQPSAAANPQFKVGANTCRFQDPIVHCDYIINMPVCWATRSDIAGASLSLKNMMGSILVVGQPDQSAMHAYFASPTTPSLAMISSQPTLKNKQVLVLMDAIAIKYDTGPFGAANKTAFSIVGSKDMVAADYQGMLILKANGLSSDREKAARDVYAMAATGAYKLGTDDPNAMEVVSIAPPYPTTKVSYQGRAVEKFGLKVKTVHPLGGSPKVTFELTGQLSGSPLLSIFALDGTRVWSSNRLEWSGQTMGGGRAGRGTFLYALSDGSDRVCGEIRMGE